MYLTELKNKNTEQVLTAGYLSEFVNKLNPSAKIKFYYQPKHITQLISADISISKSFDKIILEKFKGDNDTEMTAEIFQKLLSKLNPETEFYFRVNNCIVTLSANLAIYTSINKNQIEFENAKYFYLTPKWK